MQHPPRKEAFRAPAARTAKKALRTTALMAVPLTAFGVLALTGRLDSTLHQAQARQAPSFDIPEEEGRVRLVGPGEARNVRGWYILNNVWNEGKLVHGKDYRIASSFNPADITDNARFSWSFPRADLDPPLIRAYPQLIFGAAPKGANRNPTDKAQVLPVRIRYLSSMSVRHAVNYGGETSGFNVAYDIWLTNKRLGGERSITNEIMIWVHKGGFPAYGRKIGTYRDGAVSGSIYHKRSSKYVALVLDRPLPRGEIDLLKLLRTLQRMRIVDENDYVASVELGAEVVSGSGRLTIEDLELAVTYQRPDGPERQKVATGTGGRVLSGG